MCCQLRPQPTTASLRTMLKLFVNADRERTVSTRMQAASGGWRWEKQTLHQSPEGSHSCQYLDLGPGHRSWIKPTSLCWLSPRICGDLLSNNSNSICCSCYFSLFTVGQGSVGKLGFDIWRHGFPYNKKG